MCPFDLRLACEDLADVGVELSLTDRPVAPGVGADVDVQHIKIPKGLLVNKDPPGIMDVSAEMNLIPPKEMMGRSVDKLEARIVGRVVSDGDNIASDLRSQSATNRADVVVRIVVALQENNLALDLREIEVRLVAPGLRTTVLAVVHEVADVNEQIVGLAALIDPTDQRSVMLGHALERTVRPVDDPRILGALEVQIGGEVRFHKSNYNKI